MRNRVRFIIMAEDSKTSAELDGFPFFFFLDKQVCLKVSNF